MASYLDIGEEEGASVVIDGRTHPTPGDEGGYWLGPCLIDGVSPAMRVYRDEIFGPVLSLVRVDSLDQALDLIADNGYGNGAAIFTADGASAQRFETEVEAGMVGINVAIPVPVSSYSFGGGRVRSSVTSTSTGPTAFASTRGARRSPAAGTA